MLPIQTMPQHPLPPRRPLGGRPPRADAYGGALGTALLVLAVVALVAFIALATLNRDRADGSDGPASGETPGSADPAEAGTSPSAPSGPVDPDEDGLRFDLEVLPFREVSTGLPVAGTWLGNPTLADLDGDGDLDLVASNREEDGVSTWRFDAESGWTLEIDGLPRNMSYGPTAVADMNGDGHADLLIGDHTQGLRMFAGDGDLHWSEIERTWEHPSLLFDIDLGEIDGDGHLDVVTIAHFKGGIGVYLGDGRGGLRLLPESATIVPVRTMGPGVAPNTRLDPNQFNGTGPAPLAVDPGGLFGRDVVLLDVDRDGVLDIASTTSEGLKVFLTRLPAPDAGKERFSWEEASEGLPSPSIGNSIYGLDAGTFDEEDPVPQILTALVSDPDIKKEKRNTIGVYAWRADAGAWEQIDEGLFRSADYKDAQAADFDGDGHLDVIGASLEHGRVIFLGDGKGGFRAAGRLPGHGKCRFELGDIDGDGLVDVMVATSGVKGQNISGKLRVFLNTPDAWR